MACRGRIIHGMSDLPTALVHYVHGLAIDRRSAAYLLVGRDRSVVDSGGDLETYGLGELRAGESARDRFGFLEAILGLDAGPLTVPWVQVTPGRFADVHVVPSEEGNWVLLLDATEAAGLHQVIQQKGNELSLLRDRLEQRNRELEAANERILAANEQLRVEKANSERLLHEVIPRLVAYQGELRTLAGELSLAEERERRRLAVYLHDRIGQLLAVARAKTGAAIESAPEQAIAGTLNEIAGLIDRTIEDTRSAMFELSPPILYELGLVPALDWLAEQMHEQYSLGVEIDGDGRPVTLSDAMRSFLFRTVRELLVNVGKHARADRAEVRLRREDDDYRIVVGDDGAGFDVKSLAAPVRGRGGFGLFSIRERTDYMGGGVEIESSPGRGTRVTLVVPLGGARNGKEAAT